jgi:thioester reductase-like protein
MAGIIDRLKYWVDQHPDKLLFSFLDIQGNEVEKYTYQEFLHRTEVIASNLCNDYKFNKNDRVLLVFPAGLEMICAFFACTRLGLIPVPVCPPTSNGFQAAYFKMEYIAEDCKAAAILTSGDYYWSLKLNLTRNTIDEGTQISKLQWINTVEFKNISARPYQESHSDILFLQYTSGSTSDPKGVKVTHDNLIYNADVVVDHTPIGVSWLPQYHDMGLIGYYLFFCIKGGTTYGFSTQDFIRKPSLWLETITKYKGTASSAPNFAFDYCLIPGKIPDETMATFDLSSLKFLMTAAEPIRTATFKSFLDFFKPYGLDPQSFFAAYGLAENTLAVSNYGRKFISVNKNSLKENQLQLSAAETCESAIQLMSCGKLLGDTTVKIVDPTLFVDLGPSAIGEIWVKGSSKCLGYWNKPELSKKMFNAHIIGQNLDAENSYLRTGDIGFILDNELYICGRAKDMIIIRGLNYYPHDIEKIVEESTDLVRKGYVAAFKIDEDGEEKLIVVAGVKNKKAMPDPLKINDAIRKNLNILPQAIIFVATQSIPLTTSGKIMRQKAKQLWLDQSFEILGEFTASKETARPGANQAPTIFDDLKIKYGLTGEETFSLADALDSLDFVVLLHDIKELLKENGATNMAKEIDARLIQEISVSEFFELIDEFKSSSYLAIKRLKRIILSLQAEYKQFVQNKMIQDSRLSFNPAILPHIETGADTPNILLTGGTGFFGPFILRSLLLQKGKARLRTAIELTGRLGDQLSRDFDERVIAVRGDLATPRLGLDENTWDYLSKNIHAIYNNGAVVNYLFNYDKMRDVNVAGTNEILKLAFSGRPKVLNHVSTTFIFGWAVKDTLFETDTNTSLDLLDFGYSQTKWVSEQIVKDGMKHGLNARIFRPALITPSVEGGGENFDISIRLMAFMINHGITVDAHNQVSFTPADISANNIVAVSGVPESVNKTFHVTRDHYASMLEITDIITMLTGRKFAVYKLKKFVPKVISLCNKEDLLFPLLDFLVRSVDNISSMEFKRYDSSTYQGFRNKSRFGIQDPTLVETVRGMLIFMKKKGIIEIEFKDSKVGNPAINSIS